MKDAEAPTLSAHLLKEASRFLGYPRKQYRSKANLEMAADFHELILSVVAWRTTFAPAALAQAAEATRGKETLLDEVYCRELLSAVPQFVERTRSLTMLTLEKIPSSPQLVYLQEATRTYIAGFFRASIALARAAVEASLRERISEHFGGGEAELEHLAEFALRTRLLDNSGHGAANRVRTAGNAVLHRPDAQVSGRQALLVLEDARSVLLALAPVRAT